MLVDELSYICMKAFLYEDSICGVWEDAGTDVGGAVQVFGGGPPTQDFKELRVSARSSKGET